MATTIEERLTALEAKVAQLAGDDTPRPAQVPWWEQIAGTFKDNPEYDAAMRLGREYRQSLRPKDEQPGADTL